MLCLHDTFEFMRVAQLAGALFCFILTKINECFSYISVMTKNNRLFCLQKSHVEQHAGDFSVTVRDVRQLTQPESDLLTLLWVLEEA